MRVSVECRGGEGGNGRLLEEEVSPTFTQRAGTGAHRLHPQSPPWFLTSRLISRLPFDDLSIGLYLDQTIGLDRL